MPGSDLGTGEPEWLPGGQDLRDVALQLRLMLNSGTSFAIATVVGAHGTALRRPGTVVVISQSGETSELTRLARSKGLSQTWPPRC